MERGRLIVDAAACGSWNMAVDEALLDSAAERHETILRFYRWEPATLSLGYFQRLADRRRHAASLSCPVVRRATGGGAIVHHHELTYCFCTPIADRLGRTARSLYLALHESLVAALGRLGVAATINRQSEPAPPSGEPFLCFLRRSVGDILVGQHKVVGSAQRRSRRAVLQHGSILLVRSEYAPELPGLWDLVGQQFDVHQLIESWRETLAERLAIRLEPSKLEQQERTRAAECEAIRFASTHWTARR